MTEQLPGWDASLRFAVLGRIRGWRGDLELTLGPGKQRAVLAVLLLNSGRPVPTTTIIDAVWRDAPPVNGANVVQKYVAGLRRVLEPDRSPGLPWRVLTLDDAGYTLHVEPGGLDIDVFEQHVRRARAARAQHRLTDALEHLSAALALWHGQALAGLHGPLFDSARDRLTDDRASVLEERLEIELELGHHARLVPELTRLVAEFPVRERLRGLLMLALYRSGRQAEALAAYQEARTFLNEEFGIEPGDRLQQLHLSMLRADPALTAEARQPPETAPETVPAPTGTPEPSGVSSAGPANSAATPDPSRPSEVVLAGDGPASLPGFAPPDDPAVTPDAPADPPAGVPGPNDGWYPAAMYRPGTVAAPASPPAPPNPWTWVARLASAATCIVSIGFLGWVIIAYHAGRRRSLPLWLATAGYFACTLAFITIIQDEQTDPGWIEDGITMAMFLIASCGTAVHSALLVESRPRGAPVADLESVAVLERRILRQQARRLLEHDPAAARELRIGRPDLPRTFDDGGLVDVNGVPESVLAALPGIGADRARRIVADRRVNGSFASVQDLVARGLLAAATVNALRDTLIAVECAEPGLPPGKAGLGS